MLKYFRDKCHCCSEEHIVSWIDEAGSDLCEACAGDFFELFLRAEAAAEGER